MNRPERRPRHGGKISTALEEIAQVFGSDERAAAFQAREFLKRYPGQLQAVMLLVSARRLAGDVGGARNLLQKLAQAEPNLASVHFELALLLNESGDSEGAIAMLRRVIELEPLHDEAWRVLGDTFARSGRLAEARHAYAKHFEHNDTRSRSR